MFTLRRKISYELIFFAGFGMEIAAGEKMNQEIQGKKGENQKSNNQKQNQNH